MPRHINDNCRNCGLCVPVCPENAITEGAIYRIDPEKCTDCGACVEVCAYDAITDPPVIEEDEDEDN